MRDETGLHLNRFIASRKGVKNCKLATKMDDISCMLNKFQQGPQKVVSGRKIKKKSCLGRGLHVYEISVDSLPHDFFAAKELLQFAQLTLSKILLEAEVGLTEDGV